MSKVRKKSANYMYKGFNQVFEEEYKDIWKVVEEKYKLKINFDSEEIVVLIPVFSRTLQELTRKIIFKEDQEEKIIFSFINKSFELLLLTFYNFIIINEVLDLPHLGNTFSIKNGLFGVNRIIFLKLLKCFKFKNINKITAVLLISYFSHLIILVYWNEWRKFRLEKSY
jgi:hypothetical protein